MNPAEFANIARSEQAFWWYRGMQKIQFRMLDPVFRGRTFERVLEAGCGTGFLASVLGRRYGLPMYPVDLGWEGLEYARTMDVPRPLQCDIAAMPFPDQAFDALVSMDVLVHFAPGDENRPAAEFARVLCRGGLAVIRVSAFEMLRSRHSDFVGEQQRFTARRVRDLLERHGFRLLRSTYANTLLLPVALAKFRIWEPLIGAEPTSGVEPVSPWLDRLLGAPLAAEASLIGAGLNLPVGQSVIAVAERV
jgi:SAM-dependent methyltransferase